MSDDYEKKPTRQEWQSATDQMRQARKDKATEAGKKTIAFCLEMLAETESPAPRETIECEHDYQPSPRFARALQCTKCTNLIEDPTPPPKSADSHEAPLECYEDLAP